MNRIRLISIVAAALALGGCGSNDAKISQKVQQLRTQPTSAKVERHDVTGYLLMDGDLYVPPTSEAIVRAPYGAPVQQIMAAEGQRVGKGEVLLKMSLPDQEQSYLEAQAAVKSAETAYANAKSTYEASLREAERQLAKARDSERTLRISGDPDSLQAAVDERVAAEEAVVRARAEANSNLLPYKQQLDVARIAYQQAKSGYRQANVTAPISGTLLALNAQTGQSVTGGSEIGRIVDLGDLQIKTNLTQQQAGYVEEDKQVVITFVGLEDKPFEGSVSKVMTMPATTTGVKRQATIDFKNDAGLIKPGMQVKSVGVKIGEAHDVLAVPADAVFKDEKGVYYVRVMEKDYWMPKVVEIGLSDGFLTQIKSGVKEGETVRVPGAV